MVRKDRADYAVARVIKPDYKITDAAFGPSAVTTAGTVLNLMTSMVAGTGYKNNYIGREIQPVGLDLRISVVGALSNAFAAADLNNQTRIMVFQWMDDAVPTVASTLEGGSVLSPIEINNYNNIEVLYDENFATFMAAFDPVNNYGSSTSHTRRIYIKGKKMRNVEFNSTGGGLSKGGIYAVIVSDSAIAPSPTYAIYSRLTFLDS